MKPKPYNRCDIILPVLNELSHIKECISSIIKFTPTEIYWLYLVDDCSDSVIQNYLVSVENDHKNISLIQNITKLGYLKSCNEGFKQGEAEYALVINSEVLVVDGWLQRLMTYLEADPTIASVNPLSNYGSEVNIRIGPGANFCL